MSPLPPEALPQIVHVARQGILDARGQVFGYELLYRGGSQKTETPVDADLAGARLVTDSVLDLHLDAMTDGRIAFINLSRSLLLNGAATLLRPEVAVFELRGDIGIDAELIDACYSLSSSGFRLAIDDFVPGSAAEALLPYSAFVKVDAKTMPQSEMRPLVTRLAARGLTLVAQRVETREAFEWTRDAGCIYFQGRYVCAPQVRSGGSLGGSLAHLRLLSKLNQRRLTMDELEELVKQDAILSLRVLQCINSAAFAIRREVRSIREALVLLGIDPIRKWASVWCLGKLSVGTTSELARIAMLRARACELLAKDLPDVDPSEMFLVGLCSLLDLMLGCTMSEALAGLPLSQPARNALVGSPNALRSVLETVISYEAGSWDVALASPCVSDAWSLPRAYGAALVWAREVSAAKLAA